METSIVKAQEILTGCFHVPPNSQTVCMVCVFAALRAHAAEMRERCVKVAESLRGILPEAEDDHRRQANQFIRDVETLHGKAIAATIRAMGE